MYKNIIKSFTYDEIKIAVNKSDSYPEVCINLCLENKGNIRQNLEREIKRLNISVNHFSTIKKIENSKIRYNKDNLIKLVNSCNSIKEILIELDLLAIESNYRRLKIKLSEFGIDFSKFIKNRTSHKYSKEDLENSILISNNISECLKNLNIVSGGGNYKTFNKLVKLYNLDISHFNKNKKASSKKIDMSNILVKDSTYSRKHMKKRLYDLKLLIPICSICGQDESWHGRKISLILDHINGINNDNRIENLRIVCPNCNASLDTFAGKNNRKLKNPITLTYCLIV